MEESRKEYKGRMGERTAAILRTGNGQTGKLGQWEIICLSERGRKGKGEEKKHCQVQTQKKKEMRKAMKQEKRKVGIGSE